MGDDDAPNPHRVGAYEILLPIANGTLSSVFLARSPDVATYVAVELIRSPLATDRAFASAYLAKVKPLCRLRNANVVRTFEAARDDNGPFVVMDYVPGDSLAGLRRSARESGTTLPKAVAIRILVDALRGLHAAHDLVDESGAPLGIVHGDFSARSILVGTDGVARVTGFGFAAAHGAGGQPIGASQPHLPPEGATGDRRADVWAAGVIAWEALTGQMLGESEGASAHPPRVSSLASDVPAALDEIVDQALRPDREARTATALDLAIALGNAAEAAGLLATPNDVAAHVAQAAGPRLVERKTRFEEVRRAQADRKRPPSAPDVRTLIGMAGPMPTKRAPLDSLPDMPPAIDDGASDLRIAIAAGGAPADRANDDILGLPTAAPVEDEPHVFRSPLALEPAGHDTPSEPAEPAEPAEDRAIAGLPSTGVALRRRLLALKPLVTPPWTTQKISLFAGIGGGLIGFILVLVAVSGKTKEDPSAPGASAQAAMAVVAAGSPGAADAPEPVSAKNASGGAPSAATHAADDGRQVHVRANGPIASVRVDGRLVDAIVPAPSISVDLEEAERDRPLRIVVTSTDGRTATATTDPAGATTDVEVAFGAKSASGPRPRPHGRPAPATTVKRPWSKSKR